MGGEWKMNKMNLNPVSVGQMVKVINVSLELKEVIGFAVLVVQLQVTSIGQAVSQNLMQYMHMPHNKPKVRDPECCHQAHQTERGSTESVCIPLKTPCWVRLMRQDYSQLWAKPDMREEWSGLWRSKMWFTLVKVDKPAEVLSACMPIWIEDHWWSRKQEGLEMQDCISVSLHARYMIIINNK